MPDKTPNPLREEFLDNRYRMLSAIWSEELRPPLVGEGQTRRIQWNALGLPIPRQQPNPPAVYPNSKQRATKRRKQLQGDAPFRARQLDQLYLKYSATCFWCGEHVNRTDASREHLRPVRDFPEMARDINYMRLAHKECNI